MKSIERLPDKLLFESRWLARRNLTLQQNVLVSVLGQELELNKALSNDERAKVVRDITEGYRNLFEAGVIETDDSIRLAGAPLTAGFWKSFVEVERGKRWSWDDNSFVEQIQQLIADVIAKTCDAAANVETLIEDNAIKALFALREGKRVTDIDESMTTMISSALIAQDLGITHAVDVTFQIDSPAGRQTTRFRFFEKPGTLIRQEQIDTWLTENKTLLAGNEVSVVVLAFVRWMLPIPEELHRLGWISESYIPAVLGPNPMDQAVTKFADGDIQGSVDDFVRMLKDKEDSETRNNLGFCQILLGQRLEALPNIDKALADDYQPLYELNKGVCEFLEGDQDAAKQSLRNALQQIQTSDDLFDPWAVRYVLMLEPTERNVWYCEGLPTDAAILINLWRMGDLTRDELEAALSEVYPDRAGAWLVAYSAPEQERQRD